VRREISQCKIFDPVYEKPWQNVLRQSPYNAVLVINLSGMHQALTGAQHE
jgi:hypothetical protein